MSMAASATAATVGAGAVALFKLNRLPSSPSTSSCSCLLLKGLRAFAPFPYRYHFASYSTSILLSQEAAAAASHLPRSHAANTSSSVVEILEQRGLLKSLTSDSLRSICSSFAPNQPPLRVYCGFNPAVDSLHLGNLLGIIVLSWFLRCGHRAVALIGEATSRIGDPSGKSSERPELDLETLQKNISGIFATIRGCNLGFLETLRAKGEYQLSLTGIGDLWVFDSVDWIPYDPTIYCFFPVDSWNWLQYEVRTKF